VPALAATLILLAALASVGFYRAQAESGYPLDDSWIHLTFARNLAAGDGFGANPGEPTPGATAPLWVAILALGFLAGADHQVWPWLAGALCLAAAGVLARALVLALVAPRDAEEGSGVVQAAGLVCGLCVAWTAPLVWSGAGAMEVPLFSALVCGALVVFTRGGRRDDVRWALGWGALCGLAALARPEGLVLVPILAACNGLERRWAALRDGALALGACVLVYSPSLVFCLATSGRPFPNTFYAKTTALIAGAPDLEFLWAVLRFFAVVAPVSLAAFLVGSVGLVAAIRRAERTAPALAAIGFVMSLPLAYAVMGRTHLFAELAGNFGRYLYPVLAPALALGFAAAAGLALRSARRLATPLAIAGMLTALAASTAGVIAGSPHYAHNVRDINTLHVAMVRSLATKLPAGSLVAANDVGALAYFGRFRVLDLIGIISTPTLDALDRARRDGVARDEAYRELLRRTRPDAIVVFPGWFRKTLQGLDTSRRPIERIVNPDNITSAGKQLVAWQLDWDP
jgi:hypothetical protein